MRFNIIITGMLLTTLLYAQADKQRELLIYQRDSLEFLNYVPFQIGNKWQYEGHEFYFDSTWSTGFVESEVIGDTIMSNGLKYFIIDYIPLFGETIARIDSANQILYYYNELYGNEGCDNDEWDFLDYSFLDSAYWTDCLNNQADLHTTDLFIESLSDTFQSIVVDHWGSETQTLFSENLGISHVSYALGVSGTYYESIAATINGIQYGEFIGVNDEYSYSITLDKAEYSIGDTMKANMKMINISNDTINFAAMGWFDWRIIDSIGTTINSIHFIPIDNYYTINPGDSLTALWKSPFNTLFWGQLNYGTYYSLMKPFYNYESNEWDTASFNYVEDRVVYEHLDFFPLHIGDMWQYRITTYGNIIYHTYQIIGDTIMPNGEKYFIKQRDVGNYTQYLRIDTSSSNILYYDTQSCTTNSEMLAYPLIPYNDTTTTVIDCENSSFQLSYIDSAHLFIDTWIWYIGEELTFENGIGLVFLYGAEGTEWYHILTGAVIDGITYGEFVKVGSEYLYPQIFKLFQNHPNPFNPVTTIQYELPRRSDVQITIYDLLGRKVTTLVNQTQNAGIKSITWNATNDQGKPVSAGVYLYQIQAGEYVQTKKMVLLK